MIKVTEKIMLLPGSIEKGGYIPRLVCYVGKEHLVMLFAREKTSDNSEDISFMESFDNGQTWGKPVQPPILQPYTLNGYNMKILELAGYYDEQDGILHLLTPRHPYPGDGAAALDNDISQRYMEFVDYNPTTGDWTKLGEGGYYGITGGGVLSFISELCVTSTGRILCPGYLTVFDANGKAVHFNGCWAPANQSFAWIKEDGRPWRPGTPVDLDERSTRGFCENSIIQLADGRLGMVLRGSNDAIEDRQQGYKWVAYSSDGGESWTHPEPWTYTDGGLVESSATGCALLRAEANGKIYWIGNLCAPGERARANWPRSPLWIGEVDEMTFSLKRDTLRTIDERRSDDGPTVQFSNFRYYQEHETGDIILFVTRLGERDEMKWMDADLWKFRIQL